MAVGVGRGVTGVKVQVGSGVLVGGTGVSVGDGEGVEEGNGLVGSRNVAVAVGGRWVKGTKSTCPVRIIVEFPMQFANCNSATVTPKYRPSW